MVVHCGLVCVVWCFMLGCGTFTYVVVGSLALLARAFTCIWMCDVAWHCIVAYYIVLYVDVLHGTELYCMVLYCILLYCMVCYFNVLW